MRGYCGETRLRAGDLPWVEALGGLAEENAMATTDLTRHSGRSTLRLTTRGRKSGEPRTVTIWFVVTGPRTLLVQHARGNPAQWYLNLRRTPEVELDLGEGPTKATARPLTGPGEVGKVLAAIRRKHWLLGPLLQFGDTSRAVAAEITLA